MQLIVREQEKTRSIRSAGTFWMMAACISVCAALAFWLPVRTNAPLEVGIFSWLCGSVLVVLVWWQSIVASSRTIWWWKTLEGTWKVQDSVFPSNATSIILGFFPYRLFGRRVEVYYGGLRPWHVYNDGGAFMIEQEGGERVADEVRIAERIPDETARALMRASKYWESESSADFADCWGVPFHMRPISGGKQVLARWQGEQYVFSDPDELVRLLILGRRNYMSRHQDWLDAQNRPCDVIQALPDLFVGFKRLMQDKFPATLLEVLCHQVARIGALLADVQSESSHDTLEADVCGLVCAWKDVCVQAELAVVSSSSDKRPRVVLADLRGRIDSVALQLREVLAEVRINTRFVRSSRGQWLEASLVRALDLVVPEHDDTMRMEVGITVPVVNAAKAFLATCRKERKEEVQEIPPPKPATVPAT